MPLHQSRKGRLRGFISAGDKPLEQLRIAKLPGGPAVEKRVQVPQYLSRRSRRPCRSSPGTPTTFGIYLWPNGWRVHFFLDKTCATENPVCSKSPRARPMDRAPLSYAIDSRGVSSRQTESRCSGEIEQVQGDLNRGNGQPCPDAEPVHTVGGYIRSPVPADRPWDREGTRQEGPPRKHGSGDGSSSRPPGHEEDGRDRLLCDGGTVVWRTSVSAERSVPRLLTAFGY